MRKKEETTETNGIFMWLKEVEQNVQNEVGKGITDEIGCVEDWILMPDGIRIHAKIYRPQPEGKYPAIITRCPYVGNEIVLSMIIGPAFARHGYAFVAVEPRGTLKSQGEWLPFVNERKDGCAVIDWVADQTWCDGNIGTWGASYMGYTQWAIADYHHPALKTMFVSVSGCFPYNIFYRRGMFKEEVWTAWASQMMGDNRFKIIAGSDYADLMKKAYAVQPRRMLGEGIKGKTCEWYQKWVDNGKECDPYWNEGFWKEMKEVVSKITIPVFMHGGWFDIFLRTQMETYRALPEKVKEMSKFVIGPWHHNGIPGGDLQYPNENRFGEMMIKAGLEWYEYQLKGKEYQGFLGGIEAYHIGESCWKTYIPDFSMRENIVYYFEKADDNGKEQRLTSACPSEGHAVSYFYDPGSPKESIGGNLLVNNRNPMGQPECSVQQPEVGFRKDVVSFVSAPFTTEVRIVGSIEAHLTVSSSAESTAFTVKVMEIFSDGRAFNIRDDITDIRWVDEKTRRDYTPGEVRELSISMLDICWSMKKGSSLRVDISSSDFPQYHVHPNTIGNWAEETLSVIAEQKIYCGTEKGSYIVLPVNR